MSSRAGIRRRRRSGGLRALPRGKDMAGAIELMKSVKVYRLGQDPVTPQWVDLT